MEQLRVDHPGRDQPALEGFGLEVAPGEIVALTGPSGCGKSTLLSVLLGFVVPTSGTVRIGTVDLAEVDPEAWRRRIAWVPQRPYLFASSIDANIRLGRPSATVAEVDAAVAAAGLGPVVAGLPGGLATVLGERGVGLSAGERQRVALARAFLRDAPLLLLDEPTASLDGEVEAEVLTAVRRLAEGRTVLLVAHRPALAALADRVVAMEPRRGGGVSTNGLDAAAAPAPPAPRGRPPRRRRHRPTTRADAMTRRAAPVGRTLRLARPRLGRLILACLLGAAAIGAGIGLLATSGWLISRAAEHPSVTALGVAVVGVRFFALSRGLFRYGERLVGHDAAFRSLADERVRGLPAPRRPDAGRSALPSPRRPAQPGRGRRRRAAGPAACGSSRPGAPRC